LEAAIRLIRDGLDSWMTLINGVTYPARIT
jgi:hypothetical protein